MAYEIALIYMNVFLGHSDICMTKDPLKDGQVATTSQVFCGAGMSQKVSVDFEPKKFCFTIERPGYVLFFDPLAIPVAEQVMTGEFSSEADKVGMD